MVDVLRPAHVWEALTGRLRAVRHLDQAKGMSKLVGWVLKFLGVQVIELDFTVADLDRESDSSLYLGGVLLAEQIARAEALDSLADQSFRAITKGCDKNTIILNLAKSYFPEVLEFSIRYKVAVKLVGDDCRIELAKPSSISKSTLVSCLRFKRVCLYTPVGKTFGFFTDLWRSLLQVLLLRWYVVARSVLQPCYINSKLSGERVLSPEEDPVSGRPETRRQQFWLDDVSGTTDYYVLSSDWHPLRFSKVFEEDHCHLLPVSVRGMAIRNFAKRDNHALRLQLGLETLWRRSLTSSGPRRVKFIRTLILALRCIDMAALCKYLDIDVFLFKETHNPLTDAIQLISKDIGVRTVALQYSNLLVKNCVMQTNADQMLLFSRNFDARFSDLDFGPKNFGEVGYPYRQILSQQCSISEGALRTLRKNGVEFVLGFFDETITPGKYGFTDSKSYIDDIELLAKFVLTNPKIGVVLKPQFNRHSVSTVCGSSELVQSALRSGRLIELREGSGIRNVVYPSSVGRIANVCIGNAVGATAVLEAVLAGARGLVINPSSLPLDWPEESKKVVFRDLQSVLALLSNHNLTLSNAPHLGDWTPFISFFDRFENDNSFKRIRKQIHNS